MESLEEVREEDLVDWLKLPLVRSLLLGCSKYA
jgi:hypothetical protein